MSVGAPLASALHRAAMYRLCGAALGYPAPGRLADVARVAEVAVTAARVTLRPLVLALAEAARGADERAVAIEYVALFDGAARCAPYEGAYGPPQMAGKAAQLADIAGFYAAFGLEPSGDQPDVEDHVATELEFMSALAIKEAWALAEDHHEHAETSRDAAAAFLRDHLGRWAPAFATALGATSGLDYYHAAAALVRAWVETDAAGLEVTISPLGPAPADPVEQAPFACPMAPDD
jgi:TorA maturation chaperone TorD